MQDKINKTSFISYLFSAFIAVIPFISTLKFVDNTLLTRQMATTFLIMALSGYIIFNRKILLFPARINHVILLPGILIAGYFAGIFHAHNQVEATYWFTKISLYFSCFWVLYILLLNRIIDLMHVRRSFIFFCLFSLILIGNEVYELWKSGVKLLEEKNIYEVHGPFGHKNLFSAAGLLAIPFLLQLLIKDKKWWKMAGGLMLILMLTAMFLLQTKAVLLGIFIGAVFSFLALANVIQVRYKKVYAAGLIAFLVSAVGLFFLAYFYRERLVVLFDNVTIKERSYLWINTIKMIKEHLFFGVGGGNWQIFFPKYGLHNFLDFNYLVGRGYHTFQRPHNDFLWVWSEVGLFAFAAFLLFIGSCIFLCFKLIYAYKADAKNALVFITLLFAIIAFSFVSAFDFLLERTEHYLLFMLVAAIVFAQYDLKFKTKENTSRKSSYIITFFVLAFTLYGAYFTLNRAKAEASMLKVHAAHKQGNWQQLIRYANKAENDFYNIDNFSIPVSWYRGVAYFTLNDLANAKTNFEKAYEINPYQVQVINNIAASYEKAGDHEKALALYNEALAIFPEQRDAILNKSGVLFNQGKIEEAFFTIQKFKYDEWYDQYRQFNKVIVSAYLREKVKTEKDGAKLEKMEKVIDNQKLIEEITKESQEKNIAFMDVLFTKEF